MAIGFSIIMPTYNQMGFIKRAILSVKRQTFEQWELIIVDDGCTDETPRIVGEFLDDPRITYVKNDRNRGLGFSVNRGLDLARYDYVAYLPSDDYYDACHLASLAERYDRYDNAVLVFSGVRYGVHDSMTRIAGSESKEVMPSRGLQMAQVSHRKGSERWVERSQWEDKDLNVTFWNKLLDKGAFVPTRRASCFLTSHPRQRHSLLTEGHRGGLNLFRAHYHVEEPLKIRFHKNKFIDEEGIYAKVKDKPPQKADGLKILLVGELAYNPERVVALEEAGHKLYGLWVKHNFYGYNTVGPLPFGNVEEIGHDNWQQKVRELKPDIIYAMLNFPCIPIAYEVMTANPDIPFVWHFKEAATISLQLGTWNKLMYLYNHADGVIHISETVKEWVELFASPRGESMVLDGDLPHSVNLTGAFSPKLSDTDGAVHIMLAGRCIGLNERYMKELADNDIHVHLYTQAKHNRRAPGNERLLEVAPRHFHVHRHCSIEKWVGEFSRYDAGILHLFGSKNRGNIFRATWDDLNVPARMSTYAAAGLPMILRSNAGCVTSTNRITEELDIGIPFDDAKDLAAQLKDRQLMRRKSDNMLRHKELFTFNHHVARLEEFFKEIIRKKRHDDRR